MAAITCKKAYLAVSPSDWVYAIYLTCNDEIAVHYKHGQTVHRIPGARPPGAYLGQGGVPALCCLYPGTAGALGQKLFELATVWTYAGEFVHRFLYKKYAYQIVAPPPLPCAGCGAACLGPYWDFLLGDFLESGGGDGLLMTPTTGAPGQPPIINASESWRIKLGSWDHRGPGTNTVPSAWDSVSEQYAGSISSGGVLQGYPASLNYNRFSYDGATAPGFPAYSVGDFYWVEQTCQGVWPPEPTPQSPGHGP